MVDLEKEITEKVNDLSDEFINLLRKNQLLNQFLRNFITNIICSKVDLKINKGFKWHQKKNVWAKGFLFDSNNILYEEEKILDYFLGVKNKEEFERKLKQANGFFSVLIQYEDRIFAAVDCIRSNPLFFSEKYISV